MRRWRRLVRKCTIRLKWVMKFLKNQSCIMLVVQMKMVLVTVYHTLWDLMDMILIQISVPQELEMVLSNGQMMIGTPQIGQILNSFSFSLLMQQMQGIIFNNRQVILLMLVKKVQNLLLWIQDSLTQLVWQTYGCPYGQEQRQRFTYTLQIES